MARRRSRLWFGSVGLLVFLITPIASAGPPPPPPNTEPPPSEGGEKVQAPSDPLVIDQRTPETDITGNWTFSRRSADNQPNYVAQSEEDPFFTVNPIGYYQGVSLAGGNLPPYAPTEVGGQTAVLTWTGFERTESSSRVFFQLSAAVEPQVVVAQDKVTIELPRTSVQVRNNRRKLITRYFKTPVTEVGIVRKGKSVHAIISLRWPAEPTWTIQPGTNGYQVLTFEFPDVAGKADAQTEAAVPAPPAEAEPAEEPTKPAADSTNPFLPT
jgi:hypothetical protein